MDIMDLLTRSGTYILAVAVFIATHLTRSFCELVWPSLKKQADANAPTVIYLTKMSRWWNELVLHIIPVVYGGGSAFSASAVLFGGLDGSSKVMFGAGVGWFSGILYKTLERTLVKRLRLVDASDVSGVSEPTK